MKDLRTSLLALVLWAVALAVIFLPEIALAAACACASLAAVAAVALMTMRRRTRGAGLIVLTLLCCAAIGATVAAAQPQRDVLADSDGRAVEMIVEVASSASVGSDGRLWFDAQTLRVGPPGQLSAVSAPVRVGIEPIDGADLGARVRVAGQAKSVDAGERAALVVFGTQAEIVAPASGIFAIAATTRADFITRATRLPEPGAGLLPGLAVGDTRAVSAELNAAMLASGLSHLTAVSGPNCR
ncbi:ComEC/Rec2-related protein [Microbacterium esteraromaticum]|uniref:ComEC/Rec2-related protein n=1 Tax=Microbacterium esteraromaticum TaxID=57043 RepID=A0A1R4KFX5_9MICO|nr:DUF4131 domain-containing protein [Microbacterium esteraromaticum]SJN43199.1 ComEC/Rec2-related protein [Microbacterium esteraromaticum]